MRRAVDDSARDLPPRRRDLAQRLGALARAELLRALREIGVDLRRARQLVDGQARENTARLVRDEVHFFARPGVLLLEEQPVLVRALQANQREAPVELEAVQHEVDLAARDALL